MRRTARITLMLTAAAGAYCAALRLSATLFERHRTLLTRLYAALGRLTARSFLPAAELVASALAGAVAVWLGSALCRSVRARSPIPIVRCMAGLGCAALLMAVGMLLIWPAPLDGSPRVRAAYSRAYDIDELERLIMALNDELAVSSSQVDLSGPVMRLRDREELPGRVAAAYRRAGLESAALCRAPRHAQWMARLRIAGIFVPFTGELLINPLDMDSALPFTMLHETAHSLGALREDEANLTALLVGLRSGDPELQWTGALTALRYALDVLRTLDKARFDGLCARLEPAALRELHAQGAFTRPPRAAVERVTAEHGGVVAASGGTELMRRTDAGDSYDGLTFLLLNMMR